MSRGVLVIIVIVLILAIVGVGLALFWQPNILNRNRGNENANTPPVNSVSQANISADLRFTAEVFDKRDVNQAVTYREHEVTIERVEVTDGLTYTGPAESGKKYVIVHFSPAIFEFTPPIEEWFGQEMFVYDRDGNSYEYATSLFGPGLPNQPRFVTFLVPETSSGFSLRLVRDGEDKSIDLGV